MYSIRYIELKNNTLHKFTVTKINRCACTHQQRKRQIDAFDLLNKVRLFPLNVHRLLKLNLIPCRGRVSHQGSLRRRCNLTLISNVCQAAVKSLFWAPNGLNELPKMCFKFLFNLIGQWTMVFLTV